MTGIDLRIDTLALDGVDPSDRTAVAVALRAELTRLGASQAVPHATAIAQAIAEAGAPRP